MSGLAAVSGRVPRAREWDWNSLPKGSPPLEQAAQQAATHMDQVVLGSPIGPSRVRHLQVAMQDRYWQPSKQTLALLAIKPEIAATMLGLAPVFRLDGTTNRQMQDLHTLAQRVSLIGDQQIALHETEDGSKMLVNLDSLSESLRVLGAEASPEELQENLVDIMEPDHEVRLFADRMGQQAASRVSGVKMPADDMDSGNRIRQVGLIAYCNSDKDIVALKKTLRDWESNFQTFQHRDRTLRLCDDSPPEYATQVRELCQNHQSDIGTKVQYLGREEKDRIRREMVERITATDKFASMGLSKDQIDSMTLGMFGGFGPDGYRSGPTENRNLSTILLQGSEAFQADHDMQPRVKTLTPNWLRRYDQYPTSGPKPHQVFTTMPVDLLTQLQEEGPNPYIVSPQFSGAADPTIESIVQEKSLYSRGLTAAPDQSDSNHANQRTVWDLESRGGFRTASPMLLPKGYSSFLPLSPTVRDGDILVGRMMTKHANVQPRELARFILHTEGAGSKWGGEANLLKDTTLSQSVTSLLDTLEQGSPDSTARQILRNLADDPEWVTSHVKQVMDHHWTIGKAYVESRNKRSKALQTLLDGPADKLVKEWRPEGGGRVRISRSEVATEIEKCRRESAEMSKLRPGKRRVKEMAEQASKKLQDYALALVFRREILAVAAAAGGPAE